MFHAKPAKIARKENLIGQGARAVNADPLSVVWSLAYVPWVFERRLLPIRSLHPPNSTRTIDPDIDLLGTLFCACAEITDKKCHGNAEAYFQIN